MRACSRRIINLTSVSVKQPVDGLMLSNMARTRGIGFAKNLATELVPDKILVNNVCPGIIFTDHIRQLAAVRAEEDGITFDEALANMTADIPISRIGNLSRFSCIATCRRPNGSHHSGRLRYGEGTALMVISCRLLVVG